MIFNIIKIISLQRIKARAISKYFNDCDNPEQMIEKFKELFEHKKIILSYTIDNKNNLKLKFLGENGNVQDGQDDI